MLIDETGRKAWQTTFSDGRTDLHVKGTVRVTNTLSEESVFAGSIAGTLLPNCHDWGRYIDTRC